MATSICNDLNWFDYSCDVKGFQVHVPNEPGSAMDVLSVGTVTLPVVRGFDDRGLPLLYGKVKLRGVLYVPSARVNILASCPHPCRRKIIYLQHVTPTVERPISGILRFMDTSQPPVIAFIRSMGAWDFDRIMLSPYPHGSLLAESTLFPATTPQSLVCHWPVGQFDDFVKNYGDCLKKIGWRHYLVEKKAIGKTSPSNESPLKENPGNSHAANSQERQEDVSTESDVPNYGSPNTSDYRTLTTIEDSSVDDETVTHGNDVESNRGASKDGDTVIVKVDRDEAKVNHQEHIWADVVMKSIEGDGNEIDHSSIEANATDTDNSESMTYCIRESRSLSSEREDSGGIDSDESSEDEDDKSKLINNNPYAMVTSRLPNSAEPEPMESDTSSSSTHKSRVFLSLLDHPELTIELTPPYYYISDSDSERD